MRACQLAQLPRVRGSRSTFTPLAHAQLHVASSCRRNWSLGVRFQYPSYFVQHFQAVGCPGRRWHLHRSQWALVTSVLKKNHPRLCTSPTSRKTSLGRKSSGYAHLQAPGDPRQALRLWNFAEAMRTCIRGCMLCHMRHDRCHACMTKRCFFEGVDRAYYWYVRRLTGH